MRRLVISFVGLMVGFGASHAAVLHVSKSGFADYTGVQPAISAASPGDTVVVQADLTPYAEDIVVTQRLHLIGQGLDCSEQFWPRIDGTILFNDNSSESSISSFYIQRTMPAHLIRVEAALVSIDRCFILTGFGNDSYCLIVENSRSAHVTRSCMRSASSTGGCVYLMASSGITIENSILYDGYLVRCEGAPPPSITLRNCNLYGDQSPFPESANWTIDNCILLILNQSGTLNGTWMTSYNAIMYSMTGFPHTAGIDTIITNDPWPHRDPDLCPADWHLNPSSGLMNRGDPNAALDLDGSRRDLGIYGGPRPFVDELVPDFPFVAQFSVPVAVPQNGVFEIRSMGRVGAGQ